MRHRRRQTKKTAIYETYDRMHNKPVLTDNTIVYHAVNFKNWWFFEDGWQKTTVFGLLPIMLIALLIYLKVNHLGIFNNQYAWAMEQTKLSHTTTMLSDYSYRMKSKQEQQEQQYEELKTAYNTLTSKYYNLNKAYQELQYKNKTLISQIDRLERQIGILSAGLELNDTNTLKALSKVGRIWVDRAITTAYVPKAGGINFHGNPNNTAILFKVSAIENLKDVTYCAVDPAYIPFGSIIIIQGYDTPCVAVDTGGAIKGNHIDILMHDYNKAKKWGKRYRTIIVITPEYKK